ncbi:hypothetical protein M472_09915 [Sphingobacterium paucimobilis HER1398]|uniref:Uncharacterized protein n=1 Tax=Sphingobacterium paucimobilis HER1398 TaxID=1346330 RepID=U2HUB0_9SPHI|nr:hypothetical protein M472_09915 [Sphingobacterium paucimobilis HER1398]
MYELLDLITDGDGQMKIGIILKVYIGLCVLLVSDLVGYIVAGISLRGYYADIVVFWLWLLGSFLVIVAFWRRLSAKLLLIAILSSVLLSMLPMGLPFYTLVLSTTPFGFYGLVKI